MNEYPLLTTLEEDAAKSSLKFQANRKKDKHGNACLKEPAAGHNMQATPL